MSTRAGRVVVIGGSVGGLAAAMGLARRGFGVTVVERDLSPPTDDADRVFSDWERPNVPQFRQPHGFSARSRNLLLQHLPEVVEHLERDGGAATANFFKALAPPELWEPDDDLFDSINVRRPVFELALRRAAESETGVTFACPASAEGLVIDASSDVPRVLGVRLEGGAILDADVVLDCGGRRSPVPGWLAAEGVEIPTESQDCDTTYHTRYFRLATSSSMDPAFVVTVNTEIDRTVGFLGFPGDHSTFGLTLNTMPGDHDVKKLRHAWAWTAVANLLPSVAAWIDPSNATPLGEDVAVMSGHRNVRRHYVVDGEPLVLGLLAAGDSLCTTDPAYGWGASMALTYAFAAVEAVVAHADDPRSQALAYHASVGPEADGVYREAAAMDRRRIYRWRNLEVPEADREEMERQELIEIGVGRGATRDPVLGRAFLRRSNLIDRPDQVLDNPDVVRRASAMVDELAERERRRPGPSRADVVAALAAAAPPAAVT
ncbi:MAG TPA: hypothetical protein VFV35_01120 [Acidimicrobiales bacterium]|nr:hypothetical protein [Acidimicrobiales bacterium]